MSDAVLYVIFGVALIANALVFRHLAYKSGLQDGHNIGFALGYEQGHRESDRWWIGADDAVDAELREIRKKGVRR